MSDKTPDVKEPLATFGQRAKAALFPDYLVPILMIICGSILFAFASDAFMIVGGVVVQLCAVLIFIANLIFRPYKSRGQSSGKNRQHITVKKIVDKEKWTLADIGEGDIGLVIGRAIVSWIEVFIPIPILIPFLMISSSNNNQTLSDRLFKTVVVQVDPEEYTFKKKGEEEKIEKTTVEQEAKFCSKCGEAIKKGQAACSKCGTAVKVKKTTTKKTTTKSAEIIEGENNTLAMISKFVLIGGFIFPMLYLFLNFAKSVVVTVAFSISAWGGLWVPDLTPLFKSVDAFGIISYICFFIITGAIIILALQYTEKIRTNLFISAGLFGAFTIFWIIAYEAIWKSFDYAFFGFGSVSIMVGRVIFRVLAIAALIVSLFFFNKYIKQVNDEHNQNIPTFKGQIPLITFTALEFIVFLIGVIAVPHDAFGASIYYLSKIFHWMVLITMMIIFIGFAFRALKLNTKKIPAKT